MHDASQFDRIPNEPFTPDAPVIPEASQPSDAPEIQPAAAPETPISEPAPPVQQAPDLDLGGMWCPDSAPEAAAQSRQTVPPTVDSVWSLPPQPPVQPSRKEKKKRTWWWLWLLVGLCVGFGLGFLTARLTPARRTNRTQLQQQLPAQQGDLAERVQIADDEAILTAPAQVYSRNVASVVGIVSQSTATDRFGRQSAVTSVGTGFIITADGYVLTNYHVVEGASSITASINDGRQYAATLIGYDNDLCDLALLKIEADGLQAVTFGESDKLLVGQQVCAIGNPLGELTYSLTVGYVSAKDRIITTDGAPINMLQTDCTINSGNSGGPLFDMNGNVIGITTAKYSGTTSSGTTVEGIGFAIPIDDVIVLLDDLQTYGHLATQPYLGVQVQISAEAGDHPNGAFIRDVTKGYAAEAAGIQGGDILVGIDDYEIGSYAELVSALRHYAAGDRVTVHVWRDGSYLELPLTLSARPQNASAQIQPEETVPPTKDEFDGWSWGWSFP